MLDESQATLPKLRTDLIVSRQGESDAATLVVKDPVRGGFFRFREVEGFILARLAGTAQGLHPAGIKDPS